MPPKMHFIRPTLRTHGIGNVTGAPLRYPLGKAT